MLSELYYDRFEPPGVSYKGKLIGVESVHEPRGDRMCHEAMNKLKTMVKVSGEHKKRIILNISSAGVRILDERTMNEEYLHEVQKISFVSRDPTDARAFGLIAGDEGNHKFFAIKTEKAAYNVVLALKELFESVLKTKQKQMEDFQGSKQPSHENIYSQPDDSSETVPEGPTTATSVEEDPSSLYAVPHKTRQQDIAEREESLAELARTVEVMQEMDSQMTETKPTSSASEDLFKEFGDTLTSPLTVQSPPSQAPNPNPFGPPMGSAMNFNAGYAMPIAQQGFGMPPQQQPFPTQNAMNDPFSSPPMGQSNGNDLFSSSVMQPARPAPSQPAAAPGKPDPFSDFAILGGGGSAGDNKSGKDMFSGFKMAKPGEVGVPNLAPQQSDSTLLTSSSSSSETSGLGPDEVTPVMGETLSNSDTPREHLSDPLQSDRSELGGEKKCEGEGKDTSEAEKPEIDTEEIETDKRLQEGSKIEKSESSNHEESIMKVDESVVPQNGDMLKNELVNGGNCNEITEKDKNLDNNQLNLVSADRSKDHNSTKDGEIGPYIDHKNGSHTNGEGDSNTQDTEEKELDVRLTKPHDASNVSDLSSEENVNSTEQSSQGSISTSSDLSIQNVKLNENKLSTPSEGDATESQGHEHEPIAIESNPNIDRPSLPLKNTLQKLTLECSNTTVDNIIDKDTSNQAPPPSSSPSSSLSVEKDTSPSPEESCPSPVGPPPTLPENFDFPSPQVPPPPLPQGFSFPSPDFPPPTLTMDDDIPSPQAPPPPLPKGYDTPSAPATDTSPAPPPIPPRPRRRTNKDIPLPISLARNSQPQPPDPSPIQGLQTNWANFDDDSKGLNTDFVKPVHTTASFEDAFSSVSSNFSQQSASISIGSHSSINASSYMSRDLFQQVPFDHVALSSSAPTSSTKPSSWAAFEEAFPSSVSSSVGENHPFHPSFPSNHGIQSSSNQDEDHFKSSLPVHEDPFADDPFAIDSPSAKKTFVLDSEDNSSLANTDLFGGAPGNTGLTTSTGIPLILDDDPFGL
ncbi:uncharacterized protein [Apostichopus japonicus]|uniref:uncharacterized protein isoform X2 n=1 Tax=Stichopus japonicus TaxID=307972 RepID=UPI003AB8F471